jgi:hypothetical protein
MNTPRNGVVLLIAVTLLARMLFGSWTGLGIDESYMVAAGRTLRLGYYDHPPIAWWLAGAAERFGGADPDLVVRLPFILLFALSTWLMFRLASDLYGARAGFWAAALLNAAPVLGVTTGTWVLPDGPLVAALLGAAVCLARALAAERTPWRWWLGTGACFGVAACSKYTAAPIGLGVLLYLATEASARRWLRRPQPYVAALIGFAAFAPVIVWNAHHGWASLAFQGARADGGKWHPFGPVSTLAGEAAFFLPWIWVPLAICMWRAMRRGPEDARGWLLVCLSVPSILLFEVVSLRAHVLFHWAAPATMLAIPLLGAAAARPWRNGSMLRLGLIATAATVALGVFVDASEVRFNWLPEVIENFRMGNDPDLGAVNWSTLRTELEARDLLKRGTVVAAVRWLDAGKIDYALRGSAPVICLGADPREYGISAPAAAQAGADVLIVAPRETLASISARFGGNFDAIAELPPVTLLHAGRPAMMLPLFLGHRLH